ncbi:MAG: hypothetical protein JO108_01920 [Acidobacteriaceae bacterium]|nr:hypothetical protein [Acidobacteriaceae bacterium]
MTSPLLAIPLLVVPAVCFSLNRPAFVWSVIAIGITAWKLRRARRMQRVSETPTKAAVPRLALATLLLQMLAFAWIGAVWALEGLAQVITESPVASQIVGWIQGQRFAVLAAWLVLFAVVCGLFRLARPILAWHQRTIAAAAHSIGHERGGGTTLFSVIRRFVRIARLPRSFVR